MIYLGADSTITDNFGNTPFREQLDVQLEEIPLITNDPEAINALKLLQEKGYTLDQVNSAFENLEPVPVTYDET